MRIANILRGRLLQNSVVLFCEMDVIACYDFTKASMPKFHFCDTFHSNFRTKILYIRISIAIKREKNRENKYRHLCSITIFFIQNYPHRLNHNDYPAITRFVRSVNSTVGAVKRVFKIKKAQVMSNKLLSRRKSRRGKSRQEISQR